MRKNSETVIPMEQNEQPDQERMTFRIYLRTFWMDYLLMAILGAISAGSQSLRPAANRLFPIYFHNGEVVNPEFTYPLERNIIPSWLSALLAFVIPMIFISLMQIRLRSFNDFNTAFMGLIYAILTSTATQTIIKWLIGGLRPYFLAVCKPNILPANIGSGKGFDGLLFDRSICTGKEDEIDYALQSMPSGHSAVAFASLLYLSFYLNGKLKIFANYRPQYWKFILFFAPLLGAVLIASSLTIDHYHHWYDVLAGSTIGIMYAFGAYRFQYASIWDFRFNHIPLPRIEAERGFDYHLDHVQSALSISRKGGLNNRHALGAPFDATVTMSVSPAYGQMRM